MSCKTDLKARDGGQRGSGEKGVAIDHELAQRQRARVGRGCERVDGDERVDGRREQRQLIASDSQQRDSASTVRYQSLLCIVHQRRRLDEDEFDALAVHVLAHVNVAILTNLNVRNRQIVDNLLFAR